MATMVLNNYDWWALISEFVNIARNNMHFDVYSQTKATLGNDFNMEVIFVQLFIVLLTSRFSNSDWVNI